MVYSLRCNTPSEKALKFFWAIWLSSSDNLREYIGNSLVKWVMTSSMFSYQKDSNWNPTSVWSDKSSLYWFDIAICYFSRAYNWPKSDSRSNFYLKDFWMVCQYRSLIKSKLQEVLDKVALNKLIENQTSEREKARFLSLNQEHGNRQLPYRLLASIFCQVSFFQLWSTDWALPYMKRNGNVPIVKQDLWIHWVIMLLHFMGGAMWLRKHDA